MFLDHNTTGDGLLTALQVLAIMRRKERPLSELVQGIERFPQVLLNIAVAEKRPLEELPELVRRIRQVEDELGSRGRVLIRYSGTEREGARDGRRRGRGAGARLCRGPGGDAAARARRRGPSGAPAGAGPRRDGALREAAGGPALPAAAALAGRRRRRGAPRPGRGARRRVSERDLREVASVGAALELRMAPIPTLLKAALEARPDARGAGLERQRRARLPLDFRAWGSALAPALRTLARPGSPAWPS